MKILERLISSYGRLKLHLNRIFIQLTYTFLISLFTQPFSLNLTYMPMKVS